MTFAIQHDFVPVRAKLPDGIELHFLERGQGPALILLHGGMGDCGSWAAQMDVLAAHFRVVAYSRRHSSPNRNSPAAHTYSIDVDVNDLSALRLLLGVEAVHLVATSYGALVALAFALAHPNRVLSLVLAEPPLHRWACRTATGARLYTAFMQDVWRPAAAAFELGHERRALQLLTDGIWGHATFDSLPLRRQEAALRNAASMKTLVQARDPFPNLDPAKVARLEIRTLLIHGEHASQLHLRAMEELAGVMRCAIWAEIPGAGHGSPQENPEGFSNAVLDFLGSSPCQSSSMKG